MLFTTLLVLTLFLNNKGIFLYIHVSTKSLVNLVSLGAFLAVRESSQFFIFANGFVEKLLHLKESCSLVFFSIRIHFLKDVHDLSFNQDSAPANDPERDSWLLVAQCVGWARLYSLQTICMTICGPVPKGRTSESEGNAEWPENVFQNM